MGEDFVQQEGQGQRCHIPQDGGGGGGRRGAVLEVLPSPACCFCVCILPLLVPCNHRAGNDGGVAEPSGPGAGLHHNCMA